MILKVEASAELPDSKITTGRILLDDIPVFYIPTVAPTLVPRTTIVDTVPKVHLFGTDVSR